MTFKNATKLKWKPWKVLISKSCTEWLHYEKMIRNASDQGSDIVCAETTHGLPSDLSKGPPAEPFEDAYILDFAISCNQSIVIRRDFSIFTKNDNWMIWTWELFRQEFTRKVLLGANVLSPRGVSFRALKSFWKYIMSCILGKPSGQRADGFLPDFDTPTHSFLNGRKGGFTVIYNA